MIDAQSVREQVNCLISQAIFVAEKSRKNNRIKLNRLLAYCCSQFLCLDKRQNTENNFYVAIAIKLNEIISVSSYTIYFNDCIYLSLGATQIYSAS